MISRRKFLAQSALGASALGLLPFEAFAKTQKSKLQDFGFISNILKNEFETGDWKTVLKLAANMGYTEYEGGVKGDNPTAFVAYLKDIGLKFVAGGLGMTDDYDKSNMKFEELKSVGASYAVTYWPWFVGAPFKLEDCQKSAPILNKLGELARQQGLGFCWHNHDKEFHAMENGQLPIDYLMENTDPELVKLEMDIYWVKKGGADPLGVMQKYNGRVKIMHVKDMAPGAQQDFECAGAGIIDFAPIFAEGKKQGIKHYFVERDKVQDGMACLEVSAKYLKKLRF